MDTRLPDSNRMGPSPERDGRDFGVDEGPGPPPPRTRTVPIVPHHHYRPTASESAWVDEVAEHLMRDHPRLVPDASFLPLTASHLERVPTLHFDDLTGIPLIDRGGDMSHLEDRARIRAVDGDLLVSCNPAVPGYERYCERTLGLGHVGWLHPRTHGRRLSVATACWRNRGVRRSLIEAVRRGHLAAIHPHMGSFSVWAVASLLAQAARRRLTVIAPPPGVTSFVNDKLRFAETVRRLFGPRDVPVTFEVHNFATLARIVQRIASDTRSIVVKVPDSAGGRGNLVLPSRLLRDRSVGRIRRRLKRLLRDLPWESGNRLLVGSWESDVQATPSAQLWIPPAADGPPVLEGLFLQWLEGPERGFAGARPALLPEPVEAEIVKRSWLLGALFQRLRYVGRCSFDLILVGENLADARPEFVECNGRWGGTSLPMSLVNRLFGDWRRRPFAAAECVAPGLDRLRFEDVLTGLGSSLFDAATGQGDVVLYTPGRMSATSALDVIALGDTWDDACHRVRVSVPQQLAEIVRRHT